MAEIKNCKKHFRIILKFENSKEDLAGCNVFIAVALGLCAAVAPACYNDSILPFLNIYSCRARLGVGDIL